MGSCLILQYGYGRIINWENVQNVSASCAWSAKHYYEKTQYCNDADSSDKMLHSTTELAYGTTFLMITVFVVS